ncbi:flavin reductase family protein [Micromonospora sp. NPDC047793]|uniref:flavin reductase family protein n=1 Tax=unclassified Micromonospora TaxID=2617518 RepID=UPI00191153B9|nr:flavin reductase family protein [Verrucosispora sp. SN26_14.1]
MPGRPTPEAFRGFMSAYFTGVAVVTSVDAEGRPHGLTCNSLTSVTLDPPTLLVCLGEHSGTLGAVRDRAGFLVNLLHEGGRGAAELFASRAADRFDRVGWRENRSGGLPWLVDDAYAMAECTVADVKIVGDHAVVFGEVVAVQTTRGNPLLYGRHTFSNRTLRDTGAAGHPLIEERTGS